MKTTAKDRTRWRGYIERAGAGGWRVTILDILDDLDEALAVVEKLPKDADGKPVVNGGEYWRPCANGVLRFYAYLSPQSAQMMPYPWCRMHSTQAAAEAASPHGAKKDNPDA